MAATQTPINMLRWSCLFTCLALGQGFFLPSFSSSSASTSNHPKKSERALGEMAAVQWPYTRDSIYYGQHYHDTGAISHAVPVAVPYPIAVPAPIPPPAPAQVQMAEAQLQGASVSTIQAAAAAYHNMQLVPCLCSVPKEDFDDPNSVVVQSAQPINN